MDGNGRPLADKVVKAKLKGYISEPRYTLRDYPQTDQTVPARYARAYAYHKTAQVDRALTEADSLLAVDPNDPYFLELKGQVLLESGRPEEALAPLRKATELTLSDPLISSMFGHALIATEDLGQAHTHLSLDAWPIVSLSLSLFLSILIEQFDFDFLLTNDVCRFS